MCHIAIKGIIPLLLRVKGWHCSHCGEVEFDAGEGVRFAEAIKQVAFKLLDNHPALLNEITLRS